MLSVLMQWVFYKLTLQPIGIDSTKGFKEHVIDIMFIPWTLQAMSCPRVLMAKEKDRLRERR